MAAGSDKLLVVVGIHEGRDFAPCSGHELIIEVRFAGEVLQTDPVDHGASSHIDINNELAWEMTRKALQEHKLQRTPIKVVCFSVNKTTHKRIECGTVLLDLRSVQNQKLNTSSHWYGLLRCQYVGKRPELRISLTAEQDSITPTTTGDGPIGNTSDDNISPASSSLSLTPPITTPTMILDEINGWYMIGPPTSHQSLYIISLTLSHPHNLHKLATPPVTGTYHFSYSLIGNEIITEDFTDLTDPTDFEAERASVRIRATQDDILQLLSAQNDIQINLVHAVGRDQSVLCHGMIPIKPLTTSPSFSISCMLRNDSTMDITPTVKVTLALQHEKITKGKDNKEDDSSIIEAPSTNAPSTLSVPQPSAKRNLTQSFEEASNSSNISAKSSTPPNSHTSIISIPQPGSPVLTTPTVSAQPKLTFTSPKTSPLLMSQYTAKRQGNTSAIDEPPGSASKQQSLSMTSARTRTVTTTATAGTNGVTTGTTTAGTRTVTTGTTAGTNGVTTGTTTAGATVGIGTATIIVANEPLTKGLSKSNNKSPVGMSSLMGLAPQMEYQAAMDLEIWKMKQEDQFKKDLKLKEETHLKSLAEEFKKRDKHRDELMKQKSGHYQDLENQLAKTLQELEVHKMKLKHKEQDLTASQRRLEDDRKSLVIDVERERKIIKSEYDSLLQIERLKYQELLHQLEHAKRQINELENRLTLKDKEFTTFREQLDLKPESRLQAELSLLKVENNELQHKLELVTKSKEHYKGQWSNALKEVASMKHREQHVMRDQLKKQQKELETLRETYLQAEQQQSLQKQLENIKEETQRLRYHTMNTGTTHVPPRPMSTTLPVHHHMVSSPSRPRGLDTDIARWIEERNILLQTGVYTHSDPTIQKLDKKIQDALLEKKLNNSTT